VSDSQRPQTVLVLLKLTEDYFRGKQITSPRVDAEILLAHVLNCKRLNLYMMHDRPLADEEVDRFRELVRKRGAGAPVQHLTGEQAFLDLTLQISGKALIPRPETEGLIERIFETVAKKGDPAALRVCELGVGSGAISLSLAKAWPNAVIFGTDLSLDALDVANGNAAFHHLSERVTFLHGDLFDPLPTEHALFDVIVSNPPYIPTGDLSGLDAEVRDHEPHLALDGGADGLVVIREILKQAPAHLAKDGWCFLEIGYNQGKAVLDLLADDKNWKDGICHPDMAGRDRVIQVKRA
jgi:release factor glutamine methyltransferase